MQPILFTIGAVAVKSYAVVVGLAILIPILLLLFYEIPLQRRKNNPYLTDSLISYTPEILITTVISIVVGARLGFVLFNWELYQDDLFRILRFWRGGFVFHGGLVAALLGSSVHALIRKVPPLNLLDLAIPYVALGYTIGRFGCFLNGCCYGHVTDVPWGMVFPAVDALTRHPTQLYAVGAGFVIFVVLLSLKRLPIFTHTNGTLVAIFLILHSIYRFTIEFYRVTEPVFSFLTWPQLIASILFFVGLILFYFLYAKALNDQRR